MAIVFDYSLYEPEEITADRKIRFKAVRKIQRADWAYQEDEAQDAIKDLRSAGALILKMKDPSIEAISFISSTLSDVAWGNAGVDVEAAYSFLIYEDEELNNPCNYGM